MGLPESTRAGELAKERVMEEVHLTASRRVSRTEGDLQENRKDCAVAKNLEKPAMLCDMVY